MAASSKKKDKNAEFSVETLSKSKHGVACVANIDVRGNVSIYAIFKRSTTKNSKPVFDFATILGYVGGEFRDGFCQANLKEGESVRFLQSHIATLEGKKIGMAFVPVEQVAALFVLPLHKKSVKKGFGFPDSDTANAFEYFKQVAHYCRHAAPEEFFRAKLRSLSGRDITKARDGITGDLKLWSIDDIELEFHKCPLPPDPPNYPSGGFMNYEELPGFLQQAGWVIQAYEEAETWKKTAAGKLTSSDNYERFSGMAKQQALWYIWKGNLEKAAVMVHSWRRLEDDWKKGNPLDAKNPAIDVIFNITHNDLSAECLYDGYRKPDARLIRGNKCDICLSSDVYVYELERTIRPSNVRTCVDEGGDAEFGSEEVRNNMAKLLFAIFKFGSNHDFETSATHCFKEALHTFLEHSFNNLYWRIKPTKAMTEAVEAEAVPGFVKGLSNKAKAELNVSTFSDLCAIVLKVAIMKHCASKLGEEQMKSLGDLFSSRLGLLVNELNRMMEEEETNENSTGAECAKTVGIDLLSKTLIPSVANEFQGKWTLLPEAKRQKILTTDSKALVKTCNETFEKVNKIYSRKKKSLLNQGVEDTTKQDDATLDNNSIYCNDKKSKSDGHPEASTEPKQDGENDLDIPNVCADDPCPCKDPKKFYRHFVAVLASDKNPVPFYKCAPTGDVIMNEEMCLDKDGKNVGLMVAFDFDHVNTSMNSIAKEKFSLCPRLAVLCKRVCHNIYPLIIMSLCQGFVELQKKDSSKIEVHSCPACGQKEAKPGEFKRCGGCKSVYYCGRKCQVRDWKAGHKHKCDTSSKQAL